MATHSSVLAWRIPVNNKLQEQVRSLGQEDPLEEEMATHSSVVTWRISWRSLAGYSPLGAKSQTQLK